MKKTISISLIYLLKVSALITIGILPFSYAADIQDPHIAAHKKHAQKKGLSINKAQQTSSAGLWTVFYVLDDSTGGLYLIDGCRVRRVNAQGVVMNIAGNGTCGHSGDGDTATAAAINPLSLAIDSRGNLYIGEPGAIRKVNGQGIISTIAGKGYPGNSEDGVAASAAGFGRVYGMAFAATGNLFFSDWNNGVVRKIDTCGNIRIACGKEASAQLYQPYNLKFDAAGNLYIADAGLHNMSIMNTQGIVSRILDKDTPGDKATIANNASGKIWKPTNLAFDATGNLYVADDSNFIVRRVASIKALDVPQDIAARKNIFMYPNIADGTYILKASLHPQADSTHLSITNLTGQVVYEHTIATQGGNLTTRIATRLANGIYLLHITSGNEHNTLRFVVQE